MPRSTNTRSRQRVPRTPESSDTGSATRLDSSEKRLLQRKSEPYSMAYIRQGLGLTEDTYFEFYAATERVITTLGYSGKIFRSTAEKEKLNTELLNYVLLDNDIARQFPATTTQLKTMSGRIAFQRLVYKISTNFRRRKPLLPTHTATAPVPCEAGNPKKIETAVQRVLLPPLYCSPNIASDDVWQSMVSVTRKNGEYNVLCRLCDLALERHQSIHSNPDNGIDDIDFERLLSFLENDYDFDRNTDQFGCENECLGTVQGPIAIDNSRQWKAILAQLIRQGQSLHFHITARKYERKKRDLALP